MTNSSNFRQLWSLEEDEKLREIMANTTNIVWTEIAAQFKNRTGKQCRERWVNHLNPEITETEWTPEEDERLYNLHLQIGNKWASIAKCMQGRSENSIKNRWYSSIKKRIVQDPITGRHILRNPIARGRAKKLNFDFNSFQRKPFSSVPLFGPHTPQINFPVEKLIPGNPVYFIDPHASVPIQQNPGQQNIASLMVPDFSPRKTTAAATVTLPHALPPPIPMLPNPAALQRPVINPSSDPMSVPLNISKPILQHVVSKEAPTLSVTSLMNPNFPPKPPQPTVIRHTQAPNQHSVSTANQPK